MINEDDVDFDFGYPDGWLETVQSTGGGENSVADKPPPSVCTECGRKYKNIKRFQLHFTTHKMARACRGAPHFVALLETAISLSPTILDKILGDTPNVGKGLELQDMLRKLKSLLERTEWVDFVSLVVTSLCKCLPSGKQSPGKEMYPTPSEMKAKCMKELGTMLTKPGGLQIFEASLQNIISSVSTGVMNLFIASFIRRIADDLAFILTEMKNSVAPVTTVNKKFVGKSQPEQKNFRHIVHYVGGSVFRRILNRAYQYGKNSEKWLLGSA